VKGSYIKNRSSLLARGDKDLRSAALDIIDHALFAADPYSAAKHFLRLDGDVLSIEGLSFDLNEFERIFIIGAGKASRGIAQALEETLGDRIADGLFVLKKGDEVKLKHSQVIYASHPIPDENSYTGAVALRELAEGCTERDLVIAGITGGSSALLSMPVQGVSIEEIKKVNQILAGIKEKLRREGTPFAENVESGIMIEIPSAAVIADLLAKEVDFFSLGTNDSIQYSLAVDRVNEKVAYLYQPLHPTILRLIDNVIKCAHREGIWVGVCGEMASDPLSVLILLGLGVDEFSVAPTSLLEIKKIIRSTEWKETQEIAVKMLKSKTSYEAKRLAERKLSRRIKRIVRGNNHAG